MDCSTQIALDILTTILTGGFLLFFIETMHIESNVVQRFKSVMNPFYHKLSKMTVFVGYMLSSMSFPNTEKGKSIKRTMDYIEKEGMVPNTSGRDIPFMSSKKLEKLCNSINSIWYELEDADLRHAIIIHKDYGVTFAKEAITEVYKEFCEKDITIDDVHNVTGDFYTRYWQPVESYTSNYEYWVNKAKISRLLVYIAVGFSIISLIIIMLYANSICSAIPCLLAITSSLVLCVCIGMMGNLISLSNRLFRLS